MRSGHGRGGVPLDRGGRRAALDHPAPVARRGELPRGESRDPGQQPGLPAEGAARSRPVRRIPAELHGPRSVHPHRGIAGRTLRRRFRTDRSPLRLWIAAPVVHTGVERQDQGAGPILPQVPRPHVRRPARGVSGAGRPALRVEGIGARIRERRRRAPRLIAIGPAISGAVTSVASSVDTAVSGATTGAASSVDTAVSGVITSAASSVDTAVSGIVTGVASSAGPAVSGAAASAAPPGRRDDRRHRATRRRGRPACRSSRARRGPRPVGP